MALPGPRLAASLLALTLLASPAAVFSQEAVFTANEERAASLKDLFRSVRSTLVEETPANRRLTAQTNDAFKDTPDWARAAESYYALRRALVARANELETALDEAMAQNTSEQAGTVKSRTDRLIKKTDVLRADFEFYVRLPVLAAGEERQAAQSSMRLLAQTGQYPVAFAYFLDKTKQRQPFKPLPAGVMLFRHL